MSSSIFKAGDFCGLVMHADTSATSKQLRLPACKRYTQDAYATSQTAHFEWNVVIAISDNGTLGRLCAGATLKAALSKVQVNVVFGHVGKTGICVRRGDGAA